MSEPALQRLVFRADWLNGERARVYGTMIALAGLVLVGWMFLVPVPGTAPGGDFLSFYAAGKLALKGAAADAWRPELHEAMQHALVPDFPDYLAFFYPPPYLLLCLPLALLPLPVALVVWTVTTSGAAALGLMALVRSAGGRSLWPALILFASSGFWLNALVGQNGALSLAILALGFALLDRRPVIAGLVLSLMVIKPQLVIALPFLLAGAGRWRTFGATAAGVAVLGGAALAVFGWDAYGAFFANALAAQSAVTEARVDPALLVSVASALMRAGLPQMVAMLAQGAVAIGCLLIALRWSRHRTGAELAALLAALAPLITPYILDYDLVLASLALSFLLGRIMADGALPFEKLGLALVLLYPLPGRMFALATGWSPGPIVSLILLWLVLRRLPLSPRSLSGVPVP